MRNRALMLCTVFLLASSFANAGERKVRLDLSWNSATESTAIQGADQSLNEGKDAFRVFCDHAKRIASGPRNYGCSAGTRDNTGDFYLWDSREYRPTGETFDLFAGRTASVEDSGTAFSARLRIPVSKRWDAVLGFRQSRTRTLREEAFRDYARLDTQEPRYWFYDRQGTFGGGFHSLDLLLLSRHYREESTTVTYRSRTLTLGGEYMFLSRNRLSAAAAGGLDIRLDRSDGERIVQDYDYRVFLPESRHLFGGPVQDPRDWRDPAGESVTTHRSVTDVQLLPYLGASVDIRVIGNLSIASQARWYPTVQETLRSQESILGPFGISTRPQRFTFSVGAGYAF